MANGSSATFTKDLFNQWVKMYEETLGKLWEMPAVGPAREKTEKAMKGFSIYTNLYTAWLESTVNLQAVSMEAWRRTQEAVMTGGDGEAVQGDFKDIYKTWIEAYSETFKEFLKSGHFAADSAEFTSHLLDAQRFKREMLEDNYLKPMDLPTKSDVDEINKELYALKKIVKEAKKRGDKPPDKNEIVELRTELDALTEAVKKMSVQIKKLSEKKK